MRVTITILIVFITNILYSQSCDNIDFSNGDFKNWIGKTGTCCPIVLTSTGIIDGRHTIMKDQSAYDYYTGNNLKIIPPGYKYSARLGNRNINSQAESLSYTMTVDDDNALFIYKFAVVLEDPLHDPDDQPRFQIRVKDQSDQIIDKCTEYSVVAAANIPGFQSYLNYRWRDWTTVGLNLLPYKGQTVTIELMTGDCKLSGHFGYAYFVAECSPMEIIAAYCPGSSTAQLVAPAGFEEYKWSNGETTQIVNLNSWIDGQIFTCEVTSVTGCVATLSTKLQVAEADFAHIDNCTRKISFVNKSTNMANISYLWEFGDGATSTERHPTHVFSKGQYNVTLKVTTPTVECSKTIVKTIDVDPDIIVEDQNICFDMETLVSAKVYNSTSITWYFDRNYSIPISNNHSFTSPKLTMKTVYYIKAVSNKCTTYDSVTINVVPRPALPYIDTSVCEGNAKISLGDISSIEWYKDKLYSDFISNTSFYANITKDTVFYFIMDYPNCTLKDKIEVKSINYPNLTVNDTNICKGTSIDMRAISNSSNIKWYDSKNTLIGTGNIYTTPNLNSNTQYFIKASNNNCTTTSSINVTTLDKPVINVQNINICYASNVDITASSQPQSKIKWFKNKIYSDYIGQTKFNITALTDTIFYVEADNEGCRSRDSLQLTIVMDPYVQAMDDIYICKGEEIELRVKNYDGIISWSTDTKISPINTATYRVKASKPPCPDVYDDLTISVYEPVTITNNSIPTFKKNIEYNYKLQTSIDASFRLIDGELPKGLYLNKDGSIYGVPQVGGSSNGITIKLEITDVNACMINENVTLYGDIFIPKVFSPNGDGVNDLFMQSYDVIIFDRLGVKIFEGNNGWDGKYNNKPVPPDIYFYQISYFQDSVKKIVKGYIGIEL